MVKFRAREMKKEYKHKKYVSKKFLLEFPVKANPKIEPHKDTVFDEVEITSKKTPDKEVVIIQLIKNKYAEGNRPPQ